MEIIGKFIKVLPEQTGESARGPWIKGGFVIETEEQFAKQLAFTLWGEEKVAIIRNMPINTQIKVYFNPESREYNERWYTDLTCFRIDTFNPVVTSASAQQGVQHSPQPNLAPAQQPQPSVKEDYGCFNTTEPQEDDDLPF